MAKQNKADIEAKDDVNEKPGAKPDATPDAEPKAKAVVQLPSLGRVVLYTPPEAEANGEKPDKEYPAIVTHVWGPDVVNLAVQNDGSFVLARGDLYPTSVSKSDGDPRPGSWRWPPFVRPTT